MDACRYGGGREKAGIGAGGEGGGGGGGEARSACAAGWTGPLAVPMTGA